MLKSNIHEIFEIVVGGSGISARMFSARWILAKCVLSDLLWKRPEDFWRKNDLRNAKQKIKKYLRKKYYSIGSFSESLFRDSRGISSHDCASRYTLFISWLIVLRLFDCQFRGSSFRYDSFRYNSFRSKPARLKISTLAETIFCQKFRVPLPLRIQQCEINP